MKKQDISIETVSVEIQVVRVGGNKMTKSVFSQIEEPDHLLPELQHLRSFDSEVSTMVGYVRIDLVYWLLYVNRAGNLRKAKFEHWGYDHYDTLVRSMKDRSHLFISI